MTRGGLVRSAQVISAGWKKKKQPSHYDSFGIYGNKHESWWTHWLLNAEVISTSIGFPQEFTVN